MKKLLNSFATLLCLLALAVVINQVVCWFNTLNCDAFGCIALLVLLIPIALFTTILLIITFINLTAFIIHKILYHEK